ncbi:MAG: tetratricopeptide repeat protein, partial [Bacteroidales bacterium]|nr:tetratricopeptide repeat protein [Bacteroidales bacterium]
IFLSVFCVETAVADEEISAIDSLYALLNKQKGDSRLETMISLSEAYRLVSFNKSLKTGEAAIDYADEKGFQLVRGKILKSLGITAYQSGDYDLSLEYYDRAVAAYGQTADSGEIASVYNNMGLVHKLLGASDKALELYEKAAALQFQLGDEVLAASTGINIASIYYQKGKLDEAYDTYYKSQLVFKKTGESMHYANATYNIANVYWQWDQNDKALELLDEVLGIYREFNAQLEMSRVFYTKGLIFAYDKGDSQKALEMFRLSLDLREKIGNPKGTANVIINIANIWMEQERYADAFEFYNRGLRIHTALGHIDGILMAYYYMGLAHQKMGSYKQSNDFFDQCEAKAVEFGIKQYNDLLTEGRLRNYAALGDFKSFQVQFERFSAARDTLAERYLSLKTQEAKSSFELERLMDELARVSLVNQQQAKRIQVFHYGASALFALLFVLLLGWFYQRKIKNLGFRKTMKSLSEK